MKNPFFLFLSLSLLLSLPPLLLTNTYETCERVTGTKRVLLFAVDGLSGPVLEELLPQLPNIQSISESGRHQPCTNIMDPNCARTVTGNRYVPYPVRSGGVGSRRYDFATLQDALDSPLVDNYFWYTMPGWGGVFSGLDVDKTMVNNNSHESGRSWNGAVEKTGGSFLLQAKENGFKTALAAVPAVLTGYWTDLSTLPPRPVTPGIVDYECGFNDVTRLPLDDPEQTSTCNLDYRLSVSEAEYGATQDDKIAEFGKTLIERGCAHVVGLHIDAPDFNMHAFGMRTEQYNASLFYLDNLVGEVLEAARRDSEEYGTGWLVMLVSDHGGQTNDKASSVFIGGTFFYYLVHGQNFFADEAIPYMVGRIGSGVDLEEFVRVPRGMDVHPTILAHLGIYVFEEEIDGVVNGVEAVPPPIYDDDDDSESSAWRQEGMAWGLVMIVLGLLRWWL